ncbi:MAG: c-type cytochrome, methanol metabolism-related [Kiloniellales bacterium]|nr:c-type cytochrome, methanol metabolism-related [Kiloniellales bacterium]
MSWRSLALGVAVVMVLLVPQSDDVAAQDEEKPYRISEDGVVDWYTFSGFRRYHADCHVCHGPDGLGSTFAPALADSMKTMAYEDFVDVIVNGREVVGASEQSKMPSFGENPNVMCFIDDIYAYLKARADGVLGRGRPKKEAKPPEAKERDDSCLG